MSSSTKTEETNELSKPLDRSTKSKKAYTFWRPNPDKFGEMTEGFARFMGTPQFILYLTIFCAVWLAWNILMPNHLQFDPKDQNFTLLTLALSIQASYTAPLLLLAQNRQDDRDRVLAEQDRKVTARNLADTEYIAREIASLRIAMKELSTRDFVRSEIRTILEELDKVNDGTPPAPTETNTNRGANS